MVDNCFCIDWSCIIFPFYFCERFYKQVCSHKYRYNDCIASCKFLIVSHRLTWFYDFKINSSSIIRFSLFFILLQDVYFPSVIVCNINQIRKSFVRGLGLSNYDEIDLLYRQFYTGLDRNLTNEELNTILSLATSEVIRIQSSKHK